ncbi:MAG: hypothetical protein C0609_09840 [Deltaproteobacteria bacterium]|nr:MAG: hypothetical protein C0609_09840 [Deltaproteobacteria bacterium]
MDISTVTQTQKSNRTLILGLGNRVMSDDSAGPVALDLLLERYELPPTVDTLDGGTLGLELLTYMEGYGAIILLDCVMRGGIPGDLVEVDEEEIETVFERALSPHQMGIKDLVAVLRLQGRTPEKMVVVGVEGESVLPGIELSAPVKASMDVLVERVVSVLKRWGNSGVTLKGA